MGGAVSAGENNDDLIDNLVEAEYIKSADIIRVFRAVDRGNYYLPEHRDSAYKDLAWKHGTLHLSAPCIYAEVMESLELKAGLSFLNLGSGTGYLSTLAGLLLGPQGVNHGVEYYPEVVEYARNCLDDFRKNNEHFDEFDFCEPQFSVGNCLLISSGSRMYDRVYCGAACPEEHENYMKNLLQLNGILVMPVNDQLIQVTRVSETQWEKKNILPVSFASLIPPAKGADNVELPSVHVIGLQESCRLAIRHHLRQIVLTEHPTICSDRKPKKQRKTRPRRQRRNFNFVPVNRRIVVVGRADEDSDSDGEGRPVRQRRRENVEDDSNRHNNNGEQNSNNSDIFHDLDSDESPETLPEFLRHMRVLMDLAQREPLWQQRAELPSRIIDSDNSDGEADEIGLDEEIKGDDNDNDIKKDEENFEDSNAKAKVMPHSAAISIERNGERENFVNNETPSMSWSDKFASEEALDLSVKSQAIPIVKDVSLLGQTVTPSASTSATSGIVMGSSLEDHDIQTDDSYSTAASPMPARNGEHFNEKFRENEPSNDSAVSSTSTLLYASSRDDDNLSIAVREVGEVSNRFQGWHSYRHNYYSQDDCMLMKKDKLVEEDGDGDRVTAELPDSSSQLTLRKCLHEKIVLLPIPMSLQQYLMFR